MVDLIEAGEVVDEEAGGVVVEGEYATSSETREAAVLDPIATIPTTWASRVECGI